MTKSNMNNTVTVNATVSVDEIIKAMIANGVEVNAEDIIKGCMAAGMNFSNVGEMSKLVAATKVAGCLNKEVKKGFENHSSMVGKIVLGEVYDPYMYPNHVANQMLDILRMHMCVKHNTNINEAYRNYVGYVKSIEYTLKEIEKLSYLEKVNPIAFAENKMFFTFDTCKKILVDFYDQVIKIAHDMIYGTDIDKVLRKHDKYCRGVYRDGQSVYLLGLFWGVSVLRNGKYKLAISKNATDFYGDLLEYKTTILKANTYAQLKEATDKCMTLEFLKSNKDVYKKFNMHKDFIEAFKKRGSYYTLKGLIAFEGDYLRDQDGREFCGEAARLELQRRLYAGDKAYQFYASLKLTEKVQKIANEIGFTSKQKEKEGMVFVMAMAAFMF